MVYHDSEVHESQSVLLALYYFVIAWVLCMADELCLAIVICNKREIERKRGGGGGREKEKVSVGKLLLNYVTLD